MGPNMYTDLLKFLTLSKNVEACELQDGKTVCTDQPAQLYHYFATTQLFLVDDNFRKC